MRRLNEVNPQQAGSACGPLTGSWASKASLVLGIIQLVLGTFLVIAQIILLAVHSVGGLSCIGIVFGALIIVTGSFGIAAAKEKTRCLVVTVMVLTILSACSTFGLLFAGTAGIMTDSVFNYNEDYWDYDYDEYNNGTDSGSDSAYTARVTLMLAMHGLMMVLAGVELIVAIIASALTCRAVRCCCCCYDTQTPSYTYLVTSANQPGSPQIPTAMLSSPAVVSVDSPGGVPVMPHPTQIHQPNQMNAVPATNGLPVRQANII